MTTCVGCKHYLGGGCCRMNLEGECAAGDREMYEPESTSGPADDKGVYRYYCIARPPMNDWLPHTIFQEANFEERRYIPEIDRMAWGWIEYAHPLTCEDIENYELISAPREV